ncbi:hypothetical protein JCM11491_003886 [Sporobolomyces phaffii]
MTPEMVVRDVVASQTRATLDPSANRRRRVRSVGTAPWDGAKTTTVRRWSVALAPANVAPWTRGRVFEVESRSSLNQFSLVQFSIVLFVCTHTLLSTWTTTRTGAGRAGARGSRRRRRRKTPLSVEMSLVSNGVLFTYWVVAGAAAVYDRCRRFDRRGYAFGCVVDEARLRFAQT